MPSSIHSLETYHPPLRCEQFFDDGNLRAAKARDREELGSAMQQFASSNGFQRFSLLAVVESGHKEVLRFEAIDNTPSEFRDAASDHKQRSRDPVFQACKRLGTPFTYGLETYIASGVVDLWDEQAEYGYCSGVVSPFHYSEGKHVIVGVDRDDPLPSDPREVATMVSAFHLFATFVQCTAGELFLGCSPAIERPIDFGLSPRERECLQWGAAGKTAWETGMILSIAEGSVAKLIGSATRKLRCANKAQALVKALKLGLIH